ncbi:hypothetical protein [Parvibium lacunae]|uniref:Uncharacterized protein n=1 Tax=Parvibium lacunae TaxID=1888893 RepID=A0A368KY97_9BURK|nr:hypothetical protein [Parvibium lacunae]RCS56433.1 hypothetical protein DU000_12490 [Parvibium lacunae]
MIGLTLLVIIIGYPTLLIWVWHTTKVKQGSWIGFILLATPGVLHFWDLPVIYAHHQWICAQEGGLKVFMQPEKTDTVQFDPESYSWAESSAEYVLQKFYPAIKTVEVNNGNSTQGQRNYFTYTVDPASVGGDPNKYKFIKTPINQLSPNLYRIRKRHSPIYEGQRREYLLEKNGHRYASWTELISGWNSGGYITQDWRCEMDTPRMPTHYLVDLLTK